MPAAGGALGALVTVRVAFPPVEVDRKPLSLALVIDRSGSMGGDPIVGAKAAARTAVDMLIPGDWVSVVAFDSFVETPVRLVKVNEDRSAIRAAIDLIDVRGSTDLFGGWAEGLSQLMSCPDADVVSRVVILSDGHANHGVTDVASIASDVAQAANHGVTTTTMGLGRHYDENLLRSIADAGRGNYEFLAGPDKVIEAFEHELAGLGALRGRNVRLSATGTGITLQRHQYAVDVTTVHDDGRGVRLPDLVAGLPLEVAVTLTFAPSSATPTLVLSWDDTMTGTREEESVTLDLEAVGADAFAALAIDERVATHLTALRMAAAKLHMSQAARAGDMQAAKQTYDEISALVQSLPAGDVRDRELAELQELRDRIEQRDAQMTARYSEKFARSRINSRSDENLKRMYAAETDLRLQKTQVTRRAHGGSPSVPVTPGPSVGAMPATAGTTSGTDPRHKQVPGGVATPAGGSVLYSERMHRADGTHVDLEVVLGDITSQAVDAIVNSSNRGLFGTAGVDGQIHRSAGPALRVATEAIGSISFGEAVFTPGFGLPAQYVIHTATPPWRDSARELQVLAQCYESVFALADRLRVRTLAIPAIGTGQYQYPLSVATRVAANAVTPWLTTRGSFEKVRFVVFDQPTADAYLAESRAWR
ncbi:MAG TPA: macro domain-containing protein [Trueperaceae bacterium]|nr:macro domain-containing protein [Trueperaceae bacterium]